MFVYSDAAYREAKALIEVGLSDHAISRRTGIPRSTVSRWRKGPRIRHQAQEAAQWQIEDAPAYCYLLGLYLGDGHVFVPKAGSPIFRVTLDHRYQQIVGEAANVLASLFVDGNVRVYHRPHVGTTILQLSHPALLKAFPQHGAGRKHKRCIVLTDWQSALTHAFPERLLRGLIHSDGSRREHCELLGIRCTQSSFKNMSVSHRKSVALLDSFVGPKG